MDTYAADVIELANHLDLTGAVRIGHSTGGGEVARYVARAKPGCVAKAVLIAAVPPIMVLSAKSPWRVADRGVRRLLIGTGGQPGAVLPGCTIGPLLRFQSSRSESLEVSSGVIDNWWRQGTMGGAKAHYDYAAAYSETDFTKDLKQITGSLYRR